MTDTRRPDVAPAAAFDLLTDPDLPRLHLEVSIQNDGREAWFTVTPTGHPAEDEDGAGDLIVSLAPEAVWIAAGLIEAGESRSPAATDRRPA